MKRLIHSKSFSATCETLADRRVFHLDDKRWHAFMAALSRQPKDNPALRRLLAHKPVWKRQSGRRGSGRR